MTEKKREMERNNAKRHHAQEEFSPELLRLYYDRIFPAQTFCRWLSYGTQHEHSAGNLLTHREFSFTTGDDVYIRYLSYEDAAGLKKDLVSKLPHKIDIGAIFSANPREHKKFKLFEPLQREFIIDIDLTDYDFLDVDVKRLQTCDRCWPLMALALRVLTASLRDDFGFEHLLWVYSGRRGIHCWVCDTAARTMSNEVRSAVADYLGPKLNAATGRLQISMCVVTGRAALCPSDCFCVHERHRAALLCCVEACPWLMARTLTLRAPVSRVRSPMHPSLARAYHEELLPFFEGPLLAPTESGGFGMLDTEERQKKLLDMLCNEDIRERFLREWGQRKHETGLQRWHGLQQYVKKHHAKLVPVLVEVVFSFTCALLPRHFYASWICYGAMCMPVTMRPCIAQTHALTSMCPRV